MMNITTLKNYLNTPVPRGRALAAVTLSHSMTVTVYILSKSIWKKQDAIIVDQKMRLNIYEETTNYLLDHADDSTLLVLNEKLNYWRVVRGMPQTGDLAEPENPNPNP